MIIGLDFDDTFSKDPELWNAFILLCQKRGHRVIITTMRDTAHSARVYETVSGLAPDDFFFTALHAKRAFTERRGVWVDVWIDDKPEYVCRDHEALADSGLRWLNEDDFNSGVCKDVKK